MRLENLPVQKFEQSMELIDALSIVKEVASETIEKESVSVEDTEQERQAINIVDRLIDLFKEDEKLRHTIESILKE